MHVIRVIYSLLLFQYCRWPCLFYASHRPLVKLCTQILSDDPLFFLINSYTTGLQPAVLSYMLGTELRKFGGHVDSQEVGLPVTESGLVLPCGASGRWEA